MPGSKEHSHQISKVPSGFIEQVSQPPRSTSKHKSNKNSDTQEKKTQDILIKFVHPTSKLSHNSIDLVRQGSIQLNNKAESNRRQNQVILQKILKKDMNQQDS